MDSEHIERIKQELSQCGVSTYGNKKFAIHYLPNVIHRNEHIKAAIYGRYKQGPLLSLSAGMLVATNIRIFFLDHKPGFTTVDELAYDIVSGIKSSSSGMFSTVTLHTRIADYTIRYANPKGIKRFVEYIEKRRIETEEAGERPNKLDEHEEVQELPVVTQKIDPAAIKFINYHDTCVLSTVNRTGNVHGAVVHYSITDNNIIYVLTKAGTQKARDIYSHQQVAITVYQLDVMQSAQISGIAEIEASPEIRNKVFNELSKLHAYGGIMHLPPVMDFHQDSFVVVKIHISEAQFHDYMKTS